MNVVIETGRLLLRTFTIDDARLIYELNNDDNITRYTHDHLNSIDQAMKF
jgi:RimJ/RimL family protein N-acetyltransferase